MQAFTGLDIILNKFSSHDAMVSLRCLMQCTFVYAGQIYTALHERCSSPRRLAKGNINQALLLYLNGSTGHYTMLLILSCNSCILVVLFFAFNTVIYYFKSAMCDIQ